MKQLSKIVLSLLLIFCISGCSCSDSHSSKSPAYNDYVSAFTSGCVSRKDAIHMILSTSLSQEMMDKVSPEDFMSISPKVPGKFSYANENTIVFTPSPEFAQNTTYTVTADLGDLFDGASEFSFQFATYPLSVSGSLKGFDVTNDDKYAYSIVFTTPDSEDEATLDKALQLPLEGSKEWSHGDNNKIHELKYTIDPTKATNDLYFVKLLNSEVELPTPDSKTLSIFSVVYRADNEKYVEITFNKQLDTKQNLLGLAYIDGNKSKAVDIIGNKLKLYPDHGRTGSANVFVSAAIKSRSGVKLGNDVVTQVQLSVEYPQVQLIGRGTIVPSVSEADVTIPFRSIYMRGIKVRVFKIFENNVGQMLQNGNIDECDRLMYAGRPVAATTIFLDEQGADLTRWNNFAINLTDLVKTEPGAIYRVELSLDRRLSAWPSDSIESASREEMENEDKLVMATLNSAFNRGGYYYNGDIVDDDWWNYEYDQAEDPTTKSYYMHKTVGRNVLSTNIGLMGIKASENKYSIIATNLVSASAMSGVDIEIYSLQNQVIGTGSTNSDGLAEISIDTNKGAGHHVVAKNGKDVAYLKISNGDELSTSTFDVSGEVVQNGIKGFIYGDRGVWRPGDTLHIAFMLNDKGGNLPEKHPVTLEVKNPLGQLVKRITRAEGSYGLYTFNVPTDANAPTGSWNAQVTVGGTSFSKSLRVETIKPNRLKINLAVPEIMMAQNNQTALHVEWLNGNVASNLKYDMECTFVKADTKFDAYKGYKFDNPTVNYSSEDVEIGEGTVNEIGDSSFGLSFNNMQTAAGMLRCAITTHVYEPTGEFSTDVTQASFSPYKRYVGIHSPQEGREQLATGKNHTFDVVVVDPQGRAQSNVTLNAKVYKVGWYWWWNADNDDMASYATSEYHEAVKSQQLVTDSQGKAKISLNFNDNEWGTYLILVKDVNGGHTTGTLGYFDWPSMSDRNSDGGNDASTKLSISTDKQEYKVGDKMVVALPSSAGSRAIVSICTGTSIVDQKFVSCQDKRTEVSFEVTEQMMPNAYVCATLVQPYSHTANDMPIRLFGIKSISTTSEKSHLTPAIKVDDEIKPETECQVNISEQNGRPMAYTLAIVDEGLLDLTHFKTPDAWKAFFAREALGIRFWDMYNQVAGAFGGRIEQMFSIGGDEALYNGPKAIVNRFTPMVYFDGPFTLDKGKTNKHKIKVPNYNGRVRVMVVASDGSAYGNAEKSALVRKPLMLIGTMPRQIGVNDEMTVSATLFATKDGVGNVKTTISCEGGIEVIGDKTQSVTLSSKGDCTVSFRVKAGSESGKGLITLSASASSDKAEYSTYIDIRNVSQRMAQTTTVEIGAGETKTVNANLSLSPVTTSLEVAGVQPMNISGRIGELMVYPHGCVEQTTSKAFPQLFISDFTEPTKEQKQEIEGNIKHAISALASYQAPDGGMSYWPNQSISDTWCSAYVLHFFTEAERKGFYVSPDMRRRLISYVRAQARNWRSNDSYYRTQSIAYCLYALANCQNSELSTMNRLNEHLKSAKSSYGQSTIAMLAAAYSLSGHADVAKELLSKIPTTGTYDYSECFYLIASLKGDNKTTANTIAQSIRKRLVGNSWISTRAASLSLVAMSAYYKTIDAASELNFVATIGDDDQKISSSSMMWQSKPITTKTKPNISIKNKSNGTIFAVACTEGIASQAVIPQNDNGLSITVSYFNTNGQSINVSELDQNTTFKAVVVVRNTSGKTLENVAISHILPSGWEVLNGDQNSRLSYQDIRDDRVLSYVNTMSPGQQVSITVNLSATYSGDYYMPAITAETMYDNTVTGCTASGRTITK